MKWKLSHNAIENAGAKLPKLAEKYFRAGRRVADKKNTPEQLHRFRIQTKRFRYSLELFGPIYGPTLDRHIASLRGIQDALGKVSDMGITMSLNTNRELTIFPNVPFYGIKPLHSCGFLPQRFEDLLEAQVPRVLVP